MVGQPKREPDQESKQEGGDLNRDPQHEVLTMDSQQEDRGLTRAH